MQEVGCEAWQISLHTSLRNALCHEERKLFRNLSMTDRIPPTCAFTPRTWGVPLRTGGEHQPVALAADRQPQESLQQERYV